MTTSISSTTSRRLSAWFLLVVALLLSVPTVVAQEEHDHGDGEDHDMDMDDPNKPVDTSCVTLHQDLLRRQSDEWGSITPFTINDGTKHTPFITFDATTRKATVVIGNGDEVGGVYHPMVASDNPTTVHFITYIYAVDQNNHLFAVQTMDPNTHTEPATVVFDVPASVTEMTAFEFCNLHGLWKGPSVSTAILGLEATPVTTEDNNATVSTEKSSSDNMDNDMGMTVCRVDSPMSPAFDSFAADFIRRQSLPPFNSLIPFDEDDGTKHTPYIALHGNGSATVTVGTEGNYHVMIGANSEDSIVDDSYAATLEGNDPHWITDIYVVDQTGDIIVMESLNPTHVDIAQLTFQVPDNATTLTAYEWCNIHGLYVGPTIEVATGDRIASPFDNPPDDASLNAESAAGTNSNHSLQRWTATVALLGSALMAMLA